MTLERADVRRLQEKRAAEGSGGIVERDTRRLGMLVRAEVMAERLTKSEEWNELLSHIQAVVNEAQAQAASMQSLMDRPDQLDPNQLGQLRLQRILCLERVSILEAIMDMPREMLESGKAARSLKDRLDKKAASETN